jgi:ABC-2 type transport system permease protein
MAELMSGEAHLAGLPPIAASTQILAVAWVRWRMFANGFVRRRPAGTRQAVSLVFAILLRILVWPFLALAVVGPVLGSGFLAWTLVAENRTQNLPSLFAGIAVLWQFVAVNGLSVAAAISNFDPASLIRFPLRFGRYFVLRTLIGLLTPSTIVGCLALLAAVVGIGLARPSLALPALLSLGIYAWTNIFLTRMIGAWMERWLANRRFREIFGVLMALCAVGFQFLNVQHAPTARAPGASNGWLLHFLRVSHGYLHWLPPGFASDAILKSIHPFAWLPPFAALLASTAILAAVFAIRLHKQFLGEYLSENAAPRVRISKTSRQKTMAHFRAAVAAAAPPQSTGLAFPPTIAACLRKEWLTLRSNTAQLMGMLYPLAILIVLNRGIFSTHPRYFLPGAMAYVLAGLLATLYNIFGADGLGVQLYLLAPVRLRDVIVAKNLLSLTLIIAEAGLAWIAVSLLAHTPVPASTQVSTLFWVVFVIAANLTLGTFRSIQSPRKFVPGKLPQRRGVPGNRTSGLLVLLMLFGSLLLLVPVMLLSRHLNDPWLPAWVFAPIALAAVLSYGLLLRNADRLILARRDVFTEELCKT